MGPRIEPQMANRAIERAAMLDLKTICLAYVAAAIIQREIRSSRNGHGVPK